MPVQSIQDQYKQCASSNINVLSLSSLTVYFLGEICTLSFHRYHADKTLAIRLWCDDGSPMCTATVCIAGTPIPHQLATNEVVIKNYSENYGMVSALTACGIIEGSHAQAAVNRVYIDLCYLTPHIATLIAQAGI